MSAPPRPEPPEYLSAALLSDCQNRFGAMDGGIRRLAGEHVLGPAFTVRTLAADNRTLHLAMERVPAGAVLVVDAEGFQSRAVWGAVLTHVAKQAGVRGLVLDGATRDIAEIRDQGFPLFARGVSPAGPHKGWVGDIGGVVSCGGVTVKPGDLIFGDADGVVAVPAENVESVLAAAERRAQKESEWIERIRRNESSASILGLVDPDRAP